MGRRLLFLAAGCLVSGCVYEADVEPAGRVAQRRSAIVGSWICGWDDKVDWATLAVGWTADGYLLTLRPLGRPEPEADEPPWVVSVRPRRVGQTEIWSAWSDRRDASELKFSFARLEVAAQEKLVLASLGDGHALPARLRDISAGELAELLGDPKQTVAESHMACRRIDDSVGSAAVEQGDEADER
jgi:hypothetical protein